MAPLPAAAQQAGDHPGRYVDAYNLPGVRSHPPTREMQRCVRKYERVYDGDIAVERMAEFTVCDDNGITFRAEGMGMLPATPYGPPVGGYSGLGGADTR